MECGRSGKIFPLVFKPSCGCRERTAAGGLELSEEIAYLEPDVERNTKTVNYNELVDYGKKQRENIKKSKQQRQQPLGVSRSGAENGRLAPPGVTAAAGMRRKLTLLLVGGSVKREEKN